MLASASKNKSKHTEYCFHSITDTRFYCYRGKAEANPSREGLAMNGLLVNPWARVNNDKKKKKKPIRQCGRKRIPRMSIPVRGLEKAAGFCIIKDLQSVQTIGA